MSRQIQRRTFGATLFAVTTLALAVGAGIPSARQTAKTAAPVAQKIDDVYTRKILESTPDARILTELVDRCRRSIEGAVAASSQCIRKTTASRTRTSSVSTPSEASPRVTCGTSGSRKRAATLVAVAIADRRDQEPPALQGHYGAAHRSQDQRGGGKQLIATGKRRSTATGGIHTTETGSLKC